MKKSFIMCLAIVFISSVAGATVIHLKDGRVITGDIINKTSYYITVAEDGTIHDYYDDEIESIEEDKQEEVLLSTDAGEEEAIADSKKRLILTLMDVNGTRQDMETRMEKLLKDVDPSQRDELRKIFKIEEILDALVPVYDKYYNEDELAQIVSFHQSSVGQKVLKVTPDLINEALETIVQYFQTKTDKLNKN